MVHYLLRRFGIGAITLLLITFVIFGLIRNMPGTPLTMQLAELDPSRRLDPLDIERMKKSYGLDKPWYQAYFVWMGQVARGDLGRSITKKQPVARLIGERLGPTLLLSVSSLCLTYLLSIPLGLFCVARGGRLDERALSTGLYMLYSLPAFVAALLLLLLFYVRLEWLPLRGMTSDDHESLTAGQKLLDVLKHALLPVTCYTYGSLAYYTRFIRANMQEVIRQDYIRTARAKGAGPLRVLLVHAFRNTLIPLVTLIGLTLPGLLGGSVILEQIFTWPGMGRLFFESISERDYPTLMGLTLMFSLLTLAGQLLADVLYTLVDPRVSYS
jgi:peptide/nickel transport system permease protein